MRVEIDVDYPSLGEFLAGNWWLGVAAWYAAAYPVVMRNAARHPRWYDGLYERQEALIRMAFRTLVWAASPALAAGLVAWYVARSALDWGGPKGEWWHTPRPS